MLASGAAGRVKTKNLYRFTEEIEKKKEKVSSS
jgi:hypothetical protein